MAVLAVERVIDLAHHGFERVGADGNDLSRIGGGLTDKDIIRPSTATPTTSSKTARSDRLAATKGVQNYRIILVEYVQTGR